MSRSPKLSTCPGCGQVKLRSDYNTNPITGKVYPRCKACGNPPAPRPLAQRVCITCNVRKPLHECFTELRAPDRTYIGYRVDCKECRKANDETSRAMAASYRARPKKPPPQKSTPQPKLTGFAAWLALGR